MTEAVDGGSKQERVYALIRERILDGSYGPGFRLVIDRLADECGVSAVPVREAVRRLEAEGLVLFRPNAGPQVTPADPLLFEANFRVLAILEGYATALAAPALSEAQIETLERENETMVACIEKLDVTGLASANKRFHHEFHDTSGNPALQGLLRATERQQLAIRRTVFTHLPYRGLSAIAEHREIIRLIREGAPAADIEATAREHKLTTADSVHDWLEGHDHDHQTLLLDRRGDTGSLRERGQSAA